MLHKDCTVNGTPSRAVAAADTAEEEAAEEEEAEAEEEAEGGGGGHPGEKRAGRETERRPLNPKKKKDRCFTLRLPAGTVSR